MIAASSGAASLSEPSMPMSGLMPTRVGDELSASRAALPRCHSARAAYACASVAPGVSRARVPTSLISGGMPSDLAIAPASSCCRSRGRAPRAPRAPAW